MSYMFLNGFLWGVYTVLAVLLAGKVLKLIILIVTRRRGR